MQPSLNTASFFATAPLALALLLYACAAQADDFPGLHLPDSMHVKIVAQQMRMNGLNTRIYAFNSPQNVDELAAYFNSEWRGDMARSRVEPWHILAHRDGGYLLTVQIKSSELSNTQGFIAFTDLFDAVEQGRKPPKLDLPTLPGTQVVQDLQSTDQGRPSRTVILRSDKSAHQNLEFYRAYFREQGYKPVSRGALVKGPDGGAMILNRGAEQLNVAIAQTKDQTTITIVRVQQ